MEASLAAYAKSSLPSQLSSANDSSRPALAGIHPSYSTNDVPTLKNNRMSASDLTPPKTQAQQQFHNHNASLGRIPSNIINRHSRDLSGDSRRDDVNSYQQISSILQASAPPFSVPSTVTTPTETVPAQMAPFGNNMNNFQTPPFYGGYGLQMVNLNPMQASNPLFQQQMQLYQPQNGFIPYGNPTSSLGPVNRFQDSQTRVIQQRRMQNGEEQARFNNVQLETIQGEILGLCKDQHGCRYLQKKLEERDPQNVQMIFLETHQHVVELMTDPFGNYLCQKLLEYSNDEQRTQLIHNAAPEMVKIALNSHGTRALQKMIEFISTPEQTQMIIEALNDRVVELIQDLNGNHVIQKCLNRLSAQDAQVSRSMQFIRACLVLTSNSSSSTPLARTVWLSELTATDAAFFNAVSITLPATNVLISSARSLTMPSTSFKIRSAITFCSTSSICRSHASQTLCVTPSRDKSHSSRSKNSAAM